MIAPASPRTFVCVMTMEYLPCRCPDDPLPGLQYEALYKRSIEDPTGFWADIASQFHWEKKVCAAAGRGRGVVRAARARTCSSGICG